MERGRERRFVTPELNLQIAILSLKYLSCLIYILVFEVRTATDRNVSQGISMIVVLVAARLIDLFLHVMAVRLLERPTIVQIDLHLAEAGLHHHSMKLTHNLKVEL